MRQKLLSNNLDNQLAEVTCRSDWYMKKNLAFIVEPGGTAVVYDRLMRHWIKTELGVEIPCVRRTIRRRCWGCGKRRKLKKCGGVHINYKYILLNT